MNNNVEKKSTHSTSSEAQKHHTSSSGYIVMETLQYGADVVSKLPKNPFHVFTSDTKSFCHTLYLYVLFFGCVANGDYESIFPCLNHSIFCSFMENEIIEGHFYQKLTIFFCKTFEKILENFSLQKIKKKYF
jgi:hypothetical protein